MSATRFVIISSLLFAGVTAVAATSASDGWSAAQLDELRSLSLTALEPVPADPTNRVADDPRAARLGERLFFDTRLSSDGKVACGTCHQPDRDFQDGTALKNHAKSERAQQMARKATQRTGNGVGPVRQEI